MAYGNKNLLYKSFWFIIEKLDFLLGNRDPEAHLQYYFNMGLEKEIGGLCFYNFITDSLKR